MRTHTRAAFLALVALAGTLFPTHALGETIHRPTAAAEVWARTELYFGTNRSGGEVSDTEFARFVDTEVTPRFPDGLTLLTGFGQFKDSQGVLIREKSHVLILLYDPRMQDANKKIQQVREAYKRAYDQESVLRVDSLAFVSF